MHFDPAPGSPIDDEVTRPFGRSWSTLGCLAILGILVALLIYMLLGSGQAAPTATPRSFPSVTTPDRIVAPTPTTPATPMAARAPWPTPLKTAAAAGQTSSAPVAPSAPA